MRKFPPIGECPLICPLKTGLLYMNQHRRICVKTCIKYCIETQFIIQVLQIILQSKKCLAHSGIWRAYISPVHAYTSTSWQKVTLGSSTKHAYRVYPIRSTVPNRSTPPVLTLMCPWPCWQNLWNCFTLQLNMLHFVGTCFNKSYNNAKTCNI